MRNRNSQSYQLSRPSQLSPKRTTKKRIVMKNIRYRWRGAALCLTLSLMAAGCSMNDDLECPPEQGKPVVTGSAYLQLSLSMTGNSGTRAGNPTGGEHGDGDEPGQTYENDVNSVVTKGLRPTAKQTYTMWNLLILNTQTPTLTA